MIVLFIKHTHLENVSIRRVDKENMLSTYSFKQKLQHIYYDKQKH